jgi:hypothetical protein
MMAYCITLRSKTDRSKTETRVTGWYVGGNCRWSTDHKRRKLFDELRDAGSVCHELRALCPRNAELINIEAARCDFSQDVVSPARDRDPIHRR